LYRFFAGVHGVLAFEKEEEKGERTPLMVIMIGASLFCVLLLLLQILVPSGIFWVLCHTGRERITASFARSFVRSLASAVTFVQ
jgi:ABC-type Fe3+ transport system permease subunit